jgi:hypothetical protein
MSLDRDFVFLVCDAFKKAVERASGVTLEGREREFRRALTDHLFDKVLGWNGHSKIGEIYDIACFDDEDFPIIITETKWNVELTSEIKAKLRRRVEELGSVKYGVFATEKEFIVYEFRDYELKEITKVNVAEATGVARQEFGLAEGGRRRILNLELLQRERLVWIEDPEYFKKTYKEVSVAKREGVKLLTENLKGVVKDFTAGLMNFFDSYGKRKDHYSGKFLANTFNDWLKISMKDEEFKKGDETKRRNMIQVFCRETAYVLLGRILFIRICEDKDIIGSMVSGRGIAESLIYYGKRRIKNVFLHIFNESREEIKKYYSHLHELGFFDWWLVEEVKKGTLLYDDRQVQDRLEENLDYSIKKAFKRLTRFDFTLVDRDILGDVYQGYLPPEERRRLGEFYTPTEVVEYILDAVGYKPENEIRGKKVLDPACGSGSFLVEATQRLIERYKKVGFNLKNADDSKQIIDGCINSIYGVDIHPFACFIAEMNLLFQLVDLYGIVKQKERFYELARLNVYRTDSLTSVGEPIELAQFFDNSRRKMLIEETIGADKVKGMKYDFVVGNPPYVRKERIPIDYKEDVLNKNFSNIYHGDNDISVYFILRGIEWSKEGGKVGYIVSRKFIKTRYGEKTRDLIPNITCIEQYLDFENVEVFEDATNYPCIVVFKKESDITERQKHNAKVVIIKKEKETPSDLLKHIRSVIGNERFSDDFIDIFELPQSSLGRERWKFIPTENYKLFNRIASASEYSLIDFVDILSGVKTGKEKVYVVDEQKTEELSLEKDLLKPVLRGEDVKRYRLRYQKKYLIFPYIQIDSEYHVVDIEKYPNLNQYLSRYKEELADRYDIRQSKSKWYELRPCNYYLAFESEKIVYPDISDKSNFAYDDEGYYCLMTGFIMTIKKDYKTDSERYLKYLLGILNSRVLEFYFKQISTFLRGGYYRYKTQYLEKLPIREITDDNIHLTNEIILNVDQILQLNKRINSIEEKLENSPDSYFDGDWSFDKLANIIKNQSLPRESYTISEKSLRTDYKQRDLDGSETFRVILATNEFIDFYSIEVATYVFEVLKNMNKITKRELLELKIPQQPYLNNLMNQYREDKEQVVKNEKVVEELEKQIEDLVYKLYDISYAERRIIEDFLKKFKS